MAGYIGNAPVPQATQTRDNFTATAGQTSFATSGYTPGYLDVYLNGVRLDESDYTATNGSDVVLDTGAAVDDVVTVVAFQTFEVAGDEFTLTDITAKDSNGIQFNTDEGTGRARIDDSGNLLVGKNAATISTVGAELRNSGEVVATTDGLNVAYFNRKSSDGSIVELRKDGSTVGSIGTNTATLYIAGTDTGLQFNSGSDQIRPCNASGSSRDNAISLGTSGARFKDLYLSGGVYLGGTGSANHLDDYEEGTWTPVISDWHTGWTSTTGVTYTNNRYTKVGNLVHLTVNISGVSANTGKVYAYFSGLPFTPNFTSYGYGSSAWYQGTGENSGAGFAGVSTSGLLLIGNYNHYTTSTSDDIGVTLIYRTDS